MHRGSSNCCLISELTHVGIHRMHKWRQPPAAVLHVAVMQDGPGANFTPWQNMSTGASRCVSSEHAPMGGEHPSV